MKRNIRYFCIVVVLLLGVEICGCRQRVTEKDKADKILIQNEKKDDSQKNEKKEIEELQLNETRKEQELSAELSEENQTVSSNQEETTGESSDAGGKQKEYNHKSNYGGEKGNDKKPAGDDENEEVPAESILVYLNPGPGKCSVDRVSVEVGKSYGDLPVPFRSGYFFDGWFTSQYGGNRIEKDSMVTEKNNHTLFAHWTMREGNVLTFDGNGGRVRTDDVNRSVFPGECYGELPVPMREGYDFIGWYTAAEGGRQIYPEDIYDGDDDIVFYAHWEYNPYAYWSYVLENTTQSMFTCQQKSVYLELPDENQTDPMSPLLERIYAENSAKYVQNSNQMTDEWVLEKNPNFIVKCAWADENLSEVNARMESRFTGKKVYVVPYQALYGSAQEQLYFQLFLAKQIYPDWYESVDLDKVKNELGGVGDTN